MDYTSIALKTSINIKNFGFITDVVRDGSSIGQVGALFISSREELQDNLMEMDVSVLMVDNSIQLKTGDILTSIGRVIRKVNTISPNGSIVIYHEVEATKCI